MPRILSFILFNFISSLLLAQGANTVAEAWNNGVANNHWFVMEQDVNATNDGWEYQAVDHPLANIIQLNVEGDFTNFDFNQDSSNGQERYGAPEGWDTIGTNVFDEFYIIKVPSTGNVEITVNPICPPLPAAGPTIQWYQFNTDPLTEILWLDCLETLPLDYIDFRQFSNRVFSLDDESSSVLSKIDDDYIILRIMNRNTGFLEIFVTHMISG